LPRPGDYWLVLEAPSELIGLLKDQTEGIELIAKGDALQLFRFSLSADELAARLRHFLGHHNRPQVPTFAPMRKRSPPGARVSAPRTNKQRVSQTRGRQTKTEQAKPRIGLAWLGRQSWRHDSCMLRAGLAPIVSEWAEWHVLQKDIRDRDQEELRERALIENRARHLDEFADTAASITHMDLVISIDTSVAHLTGALGKPLWLLLPFHPDFRWLRDRQDSPWYSTAKLFRQTVDRDWSDVIMRIAEQLKVFLAARA
jgi:hypothetical protein